MKLLLGSSVVAAVTLPGTARIQPLPQVAGRLPPPGLEAVTYGYNGLLGMTPFEQQQRTNQKRLFELTESLGRSSGGYAQHDQVSKMSTAGSCRASTSTNEIWWATSSSSLAHQASSNSYDFSQETDVGVTIPVAAGVRAEISVALSRALQFSNSVSSSTASAQKASGFTRSFEAYAQRTMYSVDIDYASDSMSTWDEDFVAACCELGINSTVSEVLSFFAEIGTHGLDSAGFGQKCTSSAFLEGGSSMTVYEDFKLKSSSYNAVFLWWRSSASLQGSAEQTRGDYRGFKYVIANKQCIGELEHDSSCEALKGTGKDRPAIISWRYKPISEMPVSGLSQGAKEDGRCIPASHGGCGDVCGQKLQQQRRVRLQAIQLGFDRPHSEFGRAVRRRSMLLLRRVRGRPMRRGTSGIHFDARVPIESGVGQRIRRAPDFAGRKPFVRGGILVRWPL